jgi:cyclopropane-fatty-acyl-phospholipid synthase
MSVKEKVTKQALHYLLSQADDVPFAVRYWDDTTEQFGDDSPRFTLELRDPNVAQILREDAGTGFGDAYMHGQIEVQGDLADVVAAVARTLMKARSGEPDSVLSGYLHNVVAGAARRLGRRSHRKQQQDVARHYDLSNDFFRLWLDESMTYSCAYFRHPDDTLEQAQRQKIDHSLGKLRLQPGENLLDIGCGWGALIMRAAEQYGVQSVGITLSEEQRDGSCAEITRRGLEDSVAVRLIHYEDLAREGRMFDKIASIGMVEHVGKAHLGEFMRSVARLLRPGGLALLHQITTPDEGPFNPWLDKHIFPGAYLPTLPELLGHMMDNDLRVLDVENLRPHYRITLDHWSERFERVVPQVRAQFGEEFVRMWRLYLRSSSASFAEGSVALHQVLVSRGKSDLAPMTRDDLYQ